MEIQLFPSSAPVEIILESSALPRCVGWECEDGGDFSQKQVAKKRHWPAGGTLAAGRRTLAAGRRCPRIEMERMTDMQTKTSSGQVDCGPRVEGKRAKGANGTNLEARTENNC